MSNRHLVLFSSVWEIFSLVELWNIFMLEGEYVDYHLAPEPVPAPLLASLQSTTARQELVTSHSQHHKGSLCHFCLVFPIFHGKFGLTFLTSFMMRLPEQSTFLLLRRRSSTFICRQSIGTFSSQIEQWVTCYFIMTMSLFIMTKS